MDHDTTLRHLGGYPALRLMVNLRDLVFGKDYVRFRFSGTRNMTHCMVTLNSSDLYDLRLTQVRGVDEYARHEVKDIYCEDLARVFSEKTGLTLRVPRILGVNA